MTDADGRVATLCGGRIGAASHPQGGPSRAYLIGTRQSATIDAKRPALDAYLRDYSTGYDYRPDPQDPMQWHGGPPVPTASLSEDVAGQQPGSTIWSPPSMTTARPAMACAKRGI